MIEWLQQNDELLFPPKSVIRCVYADLLSLYDESFASNRRSPQQRTKLDANVLHGLPTVRFGVFVRKTAHLILSLRKPAQANMRITCLVGAEQH